MLVSMRNFSDKCCRENQNIYFMFYDLFPENRAFFNEIMWKNIVQQNRPQLAINSMRIACSIIKVTNIYSLLLPSNMVYATTLNVMFVCTLPVLFKFL